MALKILFGTDIGLLSLFTIGFVIAMAAYFIWYFNKKIGEDGKK
jgi:hypothetical protein